MSTRSRISEVVIAIASAAVLCIGALSTACADDRSFGAVKRLGRGINILGYDGIWEGGTDAPFKLGYLRRIREAGFQHVRINFFAFKFMDGTGLVKDDVLDRLDRVIEAVIASDLTPVLDEHDYGVCQIDVRRCSEQLKSFWTQISERYAMKHERLVFELLNEPGGAMTGAAWDTLANELLAIVRRTNQHRLVIVAAINSEDLTRIEHPRLPERDPNLALTVHYYAPFKFTHQGAPWSPELLKLKNIRWGTPADRQRLIEDFDRIAAWSRRENRPVYLGEFGVLEFAPNRDKQLYLNVVTREAEARGWAWAYWQFDHDFAAFDPATEKWVQPVLRSLIPR
jgi:endoglucanase